MSKEFEALLDLKEKHYRGYLTNDEYIEKVNEVLSNYVNDYNNANPSEALKCLKGINNYLNNVYDYKEIKEEIQKDINTIKQALLKGQTNEEILQKYYQEGITLDSVRALKQERDKYKKAFDIIKEHLSFKDSGIEEYFDIKTKQKVKKYIFEIESKDTGANIHIHLDTQDEFNSIKEMFKNE